MPVLVSLQHDQEMAIIYEHSPFANEQQLFAQFDRIAGKSGTLVICFNMRLLENGATELDFASDLADIRLTNPVDKERSVIAHQCGGGGAQCSNVQRSAGERVAQSLPGHCVCQSAHEGLH